MNNYDLKLPNYYNSHSLEMTYMEIPKCGCSSIKAHIKFKPRMQSGFNEAYYCVFTVLRDPVERFISGYMEMVRQKRHHSCRNLTEFLDYIDKYGFYDRHISPQSGYIEKHFDLHSHLIIYLFDDFKKRLTFHYNKTLDVKPVPTDEERTRIKEMYREDYKYFL